ncbi:MAG TPA: metallopeptidase TldD-related protein [Candidatus Obscuribacterales bacterium]
MVPATANESDIVFSAMEDELERCRTRLRIDGHDKPYYIGYKITESNNFHQSATFGALLGKSEYRTRNYDVDVRIGSYELDNSKIASGGFYSANYSWRMPTVSLENDYYAIRRNIWLATDRAYKQAIEDFEKKRAILKNQVAAERAPDFSKETPVVHADPLLPPPTITDERQEMIKRLSSICKRYPKIKRSNVSYSGVTENMWLVNNEGFKVRRAESGYNISINATAQADDGMTISDEDTIEVTKDGELPGYEVLERRATLLAERLSKWAAAPLADRYEGPVLFEKEAAAQLMNALLVSQLGVAKESVEETFNLSPPHSLQDRINRRILPTFMTLVDDPSAELFGKQKLYGGYAIDDEGVKPQRLAIVEKGILKTLCSGRTPCKTIRNSNGHWRNNSAQASVVLVESDSKLSPSVLRKKLMAIGKEENLPCVFLVKRIAANSDAFTRSRAVIIFADEGECTTAQASEVYRIDLRSGTEELVRIGGFAPTSFRVLRDIRAAGNDAAPYLVRRSYSTFHLVTPSLLLGEMEISKGDNRLAKPPVLKHPYFDQALDHASNQR